MMFWFYCFSLLHYVLKLMFLLIFGEMRVFNCCTLPLLVSVLCYFSLLSTQTVFYDQSSWSQLGSLTLLLKDSRDKVTYPEF